MVPRIGSAGLLGHQPTMLLENPLCVRIFQIALVFREMVVIGRMCEPSGAGSVNPWMPCLKGRLPVEIDVHNIGESTGCNVARLAMVPFSTSL